MREIIFSVLDLLGATPKLQFSWPAEPETAIYLAEQQGLFIHGAASKFPLRASFSGFLSYETSDDPEGTDGSTLTLAISPTQILIMRALLPENSPVPTCIRYSPVDPDRAKAAINTISRNVPKTKDTPRTTDDFLNGQLQIWVEPGTVIGASEDDEAIVTFIDSSNYLLHALYILARFEKYRKVGSDALEKTIKDQLSLNQVKLKDGQVFHFEENLGPEHIDPSR